MDTTTPILEYALANPILSGGTDLSPSSFILDETLLAREEKRIQAEITDDLRSLFHLLRMNVASAVHIRGAFIPNLRAATPDHFTDSSCDPIWWPAANTATALARAFDINLCSYRAENAGALYVHLVPSRSSEKSRSGLRGHTDAVALPLPGEQAEHQDLAPSPDLVILIGLRNPGLVETRLAPLSRVLRGLDKATIKCLQDPLFDFRPQASFALAQDYVNARKPIVVRDQNDGFMIRFSHSNVIASAGYEDVAGPALERLKASLANCFVSVVVSPGDILFVNNRTALHGRSTIGEVENEERRWLLRTYGMFSDSVLALAATSLKHGGGAGEKQLPYMLPPDPGGPSTPSTAPNVRRRRSPLPRE